MFVIAHRSTFMKIALKSWSNNSNICVISLLENIDVSILFQFVSFQVLIMTSDHRLKSVKFGYYVRRAFLFKPSDLEGLL